MCRFADFPVGRQPMKQKNMISKFKIYKEMFETSRDEKRGLTVYFGGQSIAGVVVEIIGTEAIEMRSREFARIVVCVEAIDALAVG